MKFLKTFNFKIILLGKIIFIKINILPTSIYYKYHICLLRCATFYKSTKCVKCWYINKQ